MSRAVHLFHGEAVEVAGNGVLQATRRHRELERLLVRRQFQETVNQASGEAVAAAPAVQSTTGPMLGSGFEDHTGQ